MKIENLETFLHEPLREIIYMLGVGHFVNKIVQLHVYVQNQLMGNPEPKAKFHLSIASFSRVNTFS